MMGSKTEEESLHSSSVGTDRDSGIVLREDNKQLNIDYLQGSSPLALTPKTKQDVLCVTKSSLTKADFFL